MIVLISVFRSLRFCLTVDGKSMSVIFRCLVKTKPCRTSVSHIAFPDTILKLLIFCKLFGGEVDDMS